MYNTTEKSQIITLTWVV